MPLLEPVARKHLHTRRIVCEGFSRSDGLWDIEAHLTDTKTYGFPNQDRGGIIEAGEPVHDMSLRVTLDLDFNIHDVVAVTDDAPFKVCKETAAGMRLLIGLKIGSGWMRDVRARVGRTQGCTHLLELLGPLATTAFQTMHKALEERANNEASHSKPGILDTCYALASDGLVVERQWPQFYTGKDRKS